MSNSKRKEIKDAGRGPVGKTAVVGAKDRESNQVAARVVESTDASTLQGFVAEHVEPGAQVYTDDAKAFQGMPFDHEAVKHSVGEYVREMAHTNGIGSFWGMLKRGYIGIYHKMSPKHLHRYICEFSGRHNVRDANTINQMSGVVTNLVGKRLTYAQLTAKNGLESGARS